MSRPAGPLLLAAALPGNGQAGLPRALRSERAPPAVLVLDEVQEPLASIDENGFLRITDRLSRSGKIGGEMVPHVRVEEEIKRILGEPGCAVTAVPDEQKGERLVVLYTRGEAARERIWAELCKTDLPRQWIPKPENFSGSRPYRSSERGRPT